MNFVEGCMKQFYINFLIFNWVNSAKLEKMIQRGPKTCDLYVHNYDLCGAT